MKNTLIATLLTLATLTSPAWTAENQAGPKGGKLFPLSDGFLEFFVRSDRTAEVVVYDASRQQVPVGDRELSITAGSRENPQKLTVTKTEAAFVTSDTLPAGDGYPIVLQLRESANSKTQTFRIRYLEEICAGCNLPEYACICHH